MNDNITPQDIRPSDKLSKEVRFTGLSWNLADARKYSSTGNLTNQHNDQVRNRQYFQHTALLKIQSPSDFHASEDCRLLQICMVLSTDTFCFVYCCHKAAKVVIQMIDFVFLSSGANNDGLPKE